MRALKRGLPERIIRRITRHPVAVVSTLSLSVRMGKDAWSLKNGEIDAPEFRRRAGGHVGTLGGGLAGAAAGAAAGSVVPGLGTMIGAFAGGMVGEIAGGKVGREAMARAEEMIFTPAISHDDAEAEPEAPFSEPPKRHL